MEKVIELSNEDTEIFYYLPVVYKSVKRKPPYKWLDNEIANHFKRVVRYINALVELRIEMEA